jgi:hypothetical protein
LSNRLITSFILGEVERVLKERFEWSEGQVQRISDRIKGKTIQVRPKARVSVIREKDDDNRILECAREGRVQYLVSGDKKHLLPLKEYQEIKILSPTEFLKL